MTILQAYLWGVLVTWIGVSGEDESADGWMTAMVSVFWFAALPIVAWGILKRLAGESNG